LSLQKFTKNSSYKKVIYTLHNNERLNSQHLILLAIFQ